MKKQLLYSNPRYYKLLKKYRNLYVRMKEMFRNGTFFQLEIRTRNTLFRKFKLLYSRITKIQLSTGIKTAGVAMAFSLISTVTSAQSNNVEWREVKKGTDVFNSGFSHGNRAIIKFIDIDGDGDEDMFLGGNSGKYTYKFYRNQGLSANERFVFDDHTVDTLSVLPLSLNINTLPPHIAFIDNDNDNDLDIYATNPNNSGAILFYKNTSSGDTLRFELTTGTENKFSTYSSIHSIAFADIDADNDIDALLLTEGDTIRYFRYATDTFVEQLEATNPFSGLTLENPTIDFKDLDGDNDIDAIAHDCNDLVFLENTSPGGQQQFTINTTDTIIRGTSGEHLYPVFADLNQDNEDDLFISDYLLHRINSFYYYQYNANDNIFKSTVTGITAPINTEVYNNLEFFDFDNDGDLDMYIDNVETNSPDRLYINVGTATNPEFQQAALETFGIPHISRACEEFIDIDGDGDLDMFHLDDSQYTKMYRNIGSATEPNFALVDSINNPMSGIIENSYPANFAFADMDNDGDYDVIISIIYEAPYYRIYKNTGDTNSAIFTTPITLNPDPFAFIGNRFAYELQPYNFDGDNKKDLIVGIYTTGDPGDYSIFRNTSTSTSINFERMTNAPLGEFTTALGAFTMVNLFGESNPSIIIDEVGIGHTRDTIRYYSYSKFLHLAPQAYSVDERSPQNTFVGRINYNYFGDSTLTFDITAGNNDNAFRLSVDSILVQSPTAINYDIIANRTFNLTIQASDGVYSVDTTYTVHVNNILLFFYDKTINIEERLPVGTAIGHINSNYDGTETVTYSITAGNNDNAFAVEGDSIVVQNASALNYDIVANRTFNLTIEATDGTVTKTATYTINLEDITLRIHDRTYLMHSESSVGTIVGEVASEYYGTDTLELSILSGNNADAFEIIDSNIVVKTANALDYSIEANRTFNLTIEAREDNNNDTIIETANYTINVTLELLNLEARTYAIDERSAEGTVVGQIISHYFGTGTVTYSITQGNTDNAFQLDGTNIVVQNSEALNYDIEANRTFSLTIEATDGTETTTAVYTININDVVTSIDNTIKDEVSIYPNPAQDKLNIDIGNNLGDKVQLLLINSSGVIVYKQIAFANTIVQINTSDLEAGIYFIEIITDNKKISEKIIIE